MRKSRPSIFLALLLITTPLLSQVSDERILTEDHFLAVLLVTARDIIVFKEDASDSQRDQEWKKYEVETCIEILALQLTNLVFGEGAPLTYSAVEDKMSSIDLPAVESGIRACESEKGKLVTIFGRASEVLKDPVQTNAALDIIERELQ